MRNLAADARQALLFLPDERGGDKKYPGKMDQGE
jgi:hypothetical protein